MSNIITGLDIGTSQIKGIVVEQGRDGKFNTVSVFKHPSLGFRKGVLVDEEDALRLFRDIIIDLEKVSKKSTDNIYITIDGDHIKPKPSRGIVAVSRADHEIQQDDIDRVTQASQSIKLPPNYTILHNITSEYFVDDVGDIKNPVGMSGNRLELSALIMGAFAPHVTNLIEIVNKAGGDIAGVIFSPLAAERSVLSKRQRELGVLMIDFGFSTTSFVVYEEGKIVHSKSIPVGSGHVTNDIAVGLKISVDVAEKLKSMYGYAISKEVSRKDKVNLSDVDSSVKDDADISKRFLSEIIEVRLEEILDLVNNELKDIGRPIQLPAGVVITGGGVKLPGFEDLVKQELKLPVSIGYPDVDFIEIINPTHKDLVDDPEFAAATGLISWGKEDIKGLSLNIVSLKNFFKN
ncbi:MAG: cell division protein FtsA, partial [Candidatus Paceibacterota bacterium]